MRENRLSGLEGGVAFGPSLPLSFGFFHPGPWLRFADSKFKVQGSKLTALIHGRADSKAGPRPVPRAQHVWRRRAFGEDAHGKCYHVAAPGSERKGKSEEGSHLHLDRET